MPTVEWTSELELWLRQQAVEAGFDAAGIAPADSATSSSRELTAGRFTAWIEAGRAGEMDYLKRRDPQGVFLRSDVQVAIPWARSVIVCAFDYRAWGPLSIEPAPRGTGWIARYAWSGREREIQEATGAESQNGESREHQDGDVNGSERDDAEKGLLPTDYHDQLLTRLQRLEAALQNRLACETRCYVDTGPILERAAAVQAGIGWIGKNTCILNQQLGSWLLLGVIVTSVPVGAGFTLQEVADRCGSCTRCIDACPTAALVAPREMDASRCISYLTVEKKGSIPEEFRSLMGRQVFGCDICQDVCPWNDKSGQRGPIPSLIFASRGMLPRQELINPELEWLAKMDATTFKRYFQNSPLERTRRKRLLRNVAIAMGNSGLQRFVTTLKNWAAAQEEDPILADAAQWAICEIERKQAGAIPSVPLC